MLSISRVREQLPGFRSFSCMVVGSFLCLPVAAFAQGTTPPASINTSASTLALVPMPREIHQGAVLSLEHGIGISSADKQSDDRFAAEDLASTLKDRGIDARADKKGRIEIILLRLDTKKAAAILARAHISFDPAMHDEGYVLVTDGNTMYDIAATGAGIYYGAQTIKQLVVGREANATLHGAAVRDWPAMKYRGLDDDLSRGPVPTLAFQKHQVRVLSEYKVNLYSPYFENTLTYASNPLAALPGGAMTLSDVEELVRYARQYHVTIIPEQEAFGHLHHVLTFDTYSELAETPHGAVLAPGQPGSLPLIRQWFTEIVSMFPGPFIHIGADETVDLGKGQTKARVDQEGLGAVYIDFLKQIYTELAPLHKKLLFWGDIAMNSPELVKTLPKDMIAIAWVYSPQPDGYDKWLLPYLNAGMETWVAPGINNWRRVYPDFNAGLDNIQKFVSDGQRRRGPVQYGLVRRAVRRSRRLAAGDEQHSAVSGSLRPGLSRRFHRQDQPGTTGNDGGADSTGECRTGCRQPPPVLGRSMERGRATDFRQTIAGRAYPAIACRASHHPDRSGTQRGHLARTGCAGCNGDGSSTNGFSRLQVRGRARNRR